MASADGRDRPEQLRRVARRQPSGLHAHASDGHLARRPHVRRPGLEWRARGVRAAPGHPVPLRRGGHRRSARRNNPRRVPEQQRLHRVRSALLRQRPRADMGSVGGLQGADGVFDNNDFVAFITRFFAGCG
ncbi:MAG: GC-type dockerin domain-anchored protein [Phycisphaerales bacterium]